MEWNLKNVLQWLLNNGYGVMVGKQFAITNAINEELTTGVTVTVPQAAVATIPKTRTAIVKVTRPDDRKDTWNKFITDADIPHRVKSPDGNTYTVRQYGNAAANKLIEILNSGIDYTIFTESTKHYYKTVSYKSMLSNYLLKEIWRGEYEEWAKGRPTENHTENRFED